MKPDYLEKLGELFANIEVKDAAGKSIPPEKVPIEMQHDIESTPYPHTNDITQSPISSVPLSDQEKSDDDKLSFFGAVGEKNADDGRNDDSGKIAHKEPVPDENFERKKRLVVEEPKTNTLIFIVFLILIIIAAVFIVWMNRSGAF